MKKGLLVITILLWNTSAITGQNLWQDASAIYRIFQEIDKFEENEEIILSEVDTKQLFDILENYCQHAIQSDGKWITMNLEACFDNPFLTLEKLPSRLRIIDNFPNEIDDQSTIALPLRDTLAISSIDDFVRSDLQFGRNTSASDFFQELNYAFEKTAILRFVLPNTRRLVQEATDDNLYAKEDYVAALRTAFIKDLRESSSLLANIDQIEHNIANKENLIFFPDCELLARYLLEDRPRQECLEFLAWNSRLNTYPADQNLKSVISTDIQEFAAEWVLIGLLNQLYASQEAEATIDQQAVFESFHDESFTTLFFALLYELAAANRFGAYTIKILEMIPSDPNKKEALISLLLSPPKGATDTSKSNYTIFSDWHGAYTDQIRSVVSTHLFNKVPQKLHNRFFRTLEDFYYLKYYLEQEQFQLSTNHLISLLNSSGESRVKIERQVAPLVSALAELASAGSTEELSKVLYRVQNATSTISKQYADLSVTLNGYLGTYGGFEFYPTVSQVTGNFAFAFYVPVGIDISLKIREGYNITTFLQVLDFGAVTSFTPGSGNNKFPALHFSNIISPGLYLTMPFKNTPISMMAGAQLGPLKRQLEVDNVVIEASAFRLGLSLAIDIPLIRLRSITKFK